METFTKRKQYKTLSWIAGGVLFVALGLWAFKSHQHARDQTRSRSYTKELRNGADGLTDKELWIEKSTNEIEAMKKRNKDLEQHNERLQKQIDAIQNIVVKLGGHLGVFDPLKGDRASSSGSAPLLSTPESTVLSQDHSQGPWLVDKLEDFVVQRGVQSREKGDSPEVLRGSSPRPHPHLLKNGIKVIQFNANGSDLDENYIFAGTYARAILVGSVTVSAGVGASSNPKPVMLRITDPGNLPSSLKSFLKDAVVIGAAYGNLSSESVVIRLERLIKIDKNKGVGIDIPIKGYVAGENGDSDIRGLVYDRAGAIARSAAISGFLSCVADFMSRNKSGITFEPHSGLAQFSPQTGAKMLEQGASKGIGNAVEKYADFIIKRAEQMQPVIKIDGGRQMTIVLTESVKASVVAMKKVRRQLYEQK